MRRTIENRSFADIMKSKTEGDSWQVKSASDPFCPGPVDIGKGKDWVSTTPKGNGDGSEGEERMAKTTNPLNNPNGGTKSINNKQVLQMDKANDADTAMDATAQQVNPGHIGKTTRPDSTYADDIDVGAFRTIYGRDPTIEELRYMAGQGEEGILNPEMFEAGTEDNGPQFDTEEEAIEAYGPSWAGKSLSQMIAERNGTGFFKTQYPVGIPTNGTVEGSIGAYRQQKLANADMARATEKVPDKIEYNSIPGRLTNSIGVHKPTSMPDVDRNFRAKKVAERFTGPGVDYGSRELDDGADILSEEEDEYEGE